MKTRALLLAILAIWAPACLGGMTDIEAGLPGLTASTAAWGDYDGDGDLDLALAGWTGSAVLTRIYRNDAGAFNDAGAGLPGIQHGSLAWGDYDNDGDLDLLLSGMVTPTEYISRIYRNDNGAFEDIGAPLAPVAYGRSAWGDFDRDGDLDILHIGSTTGWMIYSLLYRNDRGEFNLVAALDPAVHGAAAWADYDNDGDLDFVIAGDGYGGWSTRLFRNTGGAFEDAGVDLPGVADPSVAWGDYDADGDLDLLLSGQVSAIANVSKVFRNDRSAFVDIGAPLQAASYGSVAWGDYDTSGRPDIVLSGQVYNGGTVCRIYRSSGDNFVESGIALPGIHGGCALWGDYDADGDLDLVLTGYGPPYMSRIYRNDPDVPNTAPSSPAGLHSVVEGEIVTLSWSPSNDNETPSPGLGYNLRIGTTPGGSEVMPAMAAPVGLRRLPELGNAQTNTIWSVRLPADLRTYYWTVQAIDAAFAGSEFAPEAGFTAGASSVPEHPVSDPFVRLAPPAPNPTTGRVSIECELAAASGVTWKIHDAQGRRVRAIAEILEPGRHTLSWDGRDEGGRPCPAGAYRYELRAGDRVRHGGLVLVR